MKENKILLNTIHQIYTTNLKVRKKEKVLIFTDDLDKKLIKVTNMIAEKGREHSTGIICAEYTATGSHGIEPPETVWLSAFGEKTVKAIKAKKLLKPLLNKRADKTQLQKIENIIKKHKKEAVNVVIALSYYSTTHTKFRDFLTRICGARYASMPLFDKSMLLGAMRVNWQKMAQRTHNLAKRVNKGQALTIQTPNGTHLVFSTKGRKAKADTGIITQKGSSSNLPAGEVFLAPLEGTARGKLILEWAPTRKLKKPVTIYIADGMAKHVIGREKYTSYLKTKFRERKDNANVAELGIGTNDKATRPDNILESEKILGTVHVAFGDNSSFGGKVITPFHQDFVFFRPTVTLTHKTGKNEVIMRNGKLTGE